MRIAITADHNGVALKAHLAGWLAGQGHEVDDLGTDGAQQVDYPVLCARLGQQVTSGHSTRGIVIGGTGGGEAIACNKIDGIRAGLCHDLFLAEISRANNDSNVLVIGAMIVAPRLAERIVAVWLGTAFTGGRHVRRLEQIAALERGETPRSLPIKEGAAGAGSGTLTGPADGPFPSVLAAGGQEVEQPGRYGLLGLLADREVQVLRAGQALLQVAGGRRGVRRVLAGTISAGTSRVSRSSGSGPGTVSRSKSVRASPDTTSWYQPGSSWAYRLANASSERSTVTHGPTRGSAEKPRSVGGASAATSPSPPAAANARCSANRACWLIR
jgi:ribose 5-phosphate isomerase B